MLKKALEVAVTVEAADLKAKELQSSESAQLGKWNRFHQHVKTKGLAIDVVNKITALVIVSTKILSVGNVPRKVIWPKCVGAGHKVMTSLLMLETAQIRKLTG